MEKIKFPLQHPPHIFQDASFYFITTRTVNKKCYFNTDEKKSILKSSLKAGLQKYNFDLYAWVILSNHYHLFIRINYSLNLPKFIKAINGRSSFLLNKFEDRENRKIWYQYWDRCIRSEKDFWARFNYIHHNPIKHGYIKNPDQLFLYQFSLFLYQFSSYNQWLKKNGPEWMTSCFSQYPIVDFTCENDPN